MMKDSHQEWRWFHHSISILSEPILNLRQWEDALQRLWNQMPSISIMDGSPLMVAISNIGLQRSMVRLFLNMMNCNIMQNFSLYDFVLFTYIIPMVLTALMVIIDIIVRMKSGEILYSERIKRYSIMIFAPIVNLLVCMMNILLLIDNGLWYITDFLRRRISK